MNFLIKISKNLKVLLLMFPLFIFSHPKGEKIIQGDVSFQREGNLFSVNQGSEKAIIHWDDFSIAKDETANFTLPSSFSATLNRVISKSPSSIYGHLTSNGNLFLINQNGILIGPNGKIKTAGFIASTLDVTDEDFLNGSNLKFSSDSMGKLIHQGSIDSSGDIFFISRKIEDEGNTKGTNVHFLSGEEILLFKEGENTAVKVKGSGSIDQKGHIDAIKADLRAHGGDVFSLAINQEGIIHARGIEEKEGQIVLSSTKGIVKVQGELTAKTKEKGGTIHLLGEYVQLLDHANIDVSANLGEGVILVGGDYKGENPLINNARAVFTSPNVKITADATKEGKGGKIILWADELNQFYGNISAKGGKENGDGGFVEISSHGIFSAEGDITTEASNGKTGTVLFDPIDLTIDTNPNSNLTDGIMPVPPPAQPDPFYITFKSANTANINVVNLTNALAVNNIIIDVSGAGAGTGTVTIASPVTWYAPTTLKIITPQDILINANMRNLYPSGSFTAFDLQANTTGGTTGTFVGITMNGTWITTVNGNISLNGHGGDNQASTQGILLTNQALITTTNGAITLKGTAYHLSECEGIKVDSSVISTTGRGTIHMTGKGGGTYNGASTDRPWGIRVLPSSDVGVKSEIKSTAVGGGSITLIGYGDVATGDDRLFGVDLEGGELTTVDGNIYITGNGGTDFWSGLQAHGVEFGGDGQDHFTVTSTGQGTINISGTSGYNAGIGVLISADTGSTITSSYGDINITGISTAHDVSSNYGIYVGQQSLIQSLQTANITLTGTGSGTGTTDQNHGITLEDSCRILTKDGSIVLNGQAGDATGNSNIGIQIINDHIRSTGKGDITLNGTGGDSVGTGNSGISANGGDIQSQGSGNIYLYGTGKGSGLACNGIDMGNNSDITATGSGSITIVATGSTYGGNGSNGLDIADISVISTTSGTITITATGGGASNDGLYIQSGRIFSTGPTGIINITGIPTGAATGIYVNAGTIGDATTKAPIILNTDSISLIPIFSPIVRTTGSLGSVTIQPILKTSSINLGNAGATLDLTSDTIWKIATGSPGLYVGHEDGTHNITLQNLILTSALFPSLFLRGESITLNDPIDIKTANLTAIIGPAGAGYFYFNNTTQLIPNTVQLIGGNLAVSNNFYGSNTVNNWNITDMNTGNFTNSSGYIVNFSNVGSLIGSTLSDTFTFASQKLLQGYVDGGAPAMGNYLVYPDWAPPAIVQFTGPYNGVASNIDSGFMNIENIFGVGNTTHILAALSTQMSLSYLYMNPSRRDDLYTNLQTFLLCNSLLAKHIFGPVMEAEVVYETFKTGEHINPLDSFEINVPNFKRYHGTTKYKFFPSP